MSLLLITTSKFGAALHTIDSKALIVKIFYFFLLVLILNKYALNAQEILSLNKKIIVEKASDFENNRGICFRILYKNKSLSYKMEIE